MNKTILGVTVAIIIAIVTLNILVPKTPETANQTSVMTSVAESPTSVVPLECNGKPISALTEGPYYTANTPERTDITEGKAVGSSLTLTGYVMDSNCQPIANAFLDFWQADGNGEYDNANYLLRGHQFTDSQGRYTLQTVVPGEYPGRTPHIHFKVRVNNQSEMITSQLFLPDSAQNQTDGIFDESLIINMQDSGSQKIATYNIILP